MTARLEQPKNAACESAPSPARRRHRAPRETTPMPTPRLRASWLLACPLFLLLAGAALQDGHVPDRGDGAFLFAYRPRPGMDATFEEGYRRHLGWHESRGDTLAWLAWTVVSGPGMGLFVDGVFGIPFRAMDERVDPGGDAADAAANVTAFGDPAYLHAYRLRRDLGSATRLERARPAAMQKVVWLTVRAGSEAAFEDALAGLTRPRREGLDYAVYERVAGGVEPGYLLAVQVAAFAELEDEAADPTGAILRAAGSAVVRAEAELWRYRPDLTYIPKR